MAVLKAINGHTGCGRIKDYLEKGGRALLRDFFNLSWDEVEDKGLDAALKDEVDWALEMDALRHDYGNDRPWKGQRAIMFRHYVISPDPSDNIGLEGLRELAHAWVKKHFSDYQVAVVYHDDNRQGIPHAHIVVNNTNLETGRRLHIPNALDMNRSLQEIARARGLTAFDNEMPRGRAGQGDPRTPPRPRTRCATYINKAERGILDAGGYSWVSDIRNRVSVAKVLSRNEGEFMRILELMEIEVAENSSQAPREDWIFSLADQPSRKVSGERLGMTFGKIALTERFVRIGSYHPDAASSRAILSMATDAVEIKDVAELGSLAKAVETNAQYSIRSSGDYGRRIEREPEAKAAAKCAERIQELAEAREYASRHSLVPDEESARRHQGSGSDRWQYGCSVAGTGLRGRLRAPLRQGGTAGTGNRKGVVDEGSGQVQERAAGRLRHGLVHARAAVR